jgi:hypothetical protein
MHPDEHGLDINIDNPSCYPYQVQGVYPQITQISQIKNKKSV